MGWIVRGCFELFRNEMVCFIKPTIQIWCSSTEVSHLRAAAEILSGVLRGNKESLPRIKLKHKR
jgi:hypothetical protein